MLELARRPLEADCFDVVWQDGTGRILLQFCGASRARAGRARRRRPPTSTGTPCARCSARDGVVLKVSGRPTDLPDVIRAAGATRTVVSRAALGLSWIAFAGRRPRRARRDVAPGALAARLHGARRRRPHRDQWPRRRPGAGRDGAPEGALRPGPDLPSGRLRRRHMSAAWDLDQHPPEPDLIRDCVHCGFCLPTCPSLRGLRGRDGLAARAHRADAGRPRGGRDDLARDGHALRPLPGLHGVRDRLPVRRAVRQADRARAAADRALARRARGRSARTARRSSRVFTHPARLRALAPGAQARPEARAAGPGRAAAVDALAGAAPRPATGRCRRSQDRQGAGQARDRRVHAGLHPARVLRRRQRRDACAC